MSVVTRTGPLLEIEGGDDGTVTVRLPGLTSTVIDLAAAEELAAGLQRVVAEASARRPLADVVRLAPRRHA